MTQQEMSAAKRPQLQFNVKLSRDKILNPQSIAGYGGVAADRPVLVILAAGKGTRFGQAPKCVQPVHGAPLARHSIDAFRYFSPSPVIALVGYRHEEVAAALGEDNIYVRSDNPTGGTAYAAFEALCVPGLKEKNPLLIITMGDRIVPASVFRRLVETHGAGEHEADLTFLTAQYEAPKNRGKGRIIRDEGGRVMRIMEERDILAEADALKRQMLLNLTEGNCPLYAVRAATLERYLKNLDNDNAQGQYYLTDIIGAISRDGGDIRTIHTKIDDPEYDLLVSDVTRPMDLALLEGIVSSDSGLLFPDEPEVEKAADSIIADRPKGQVASIARQLEELLALIAEKNLDFKPEQPAAIGIAGGRLRIAFMHPDMGRFFGPAWQMPIGAADEKGGEQIIVLMQGANDRKINYYPTNPEYREVFDYIPADNEAMYPGEHISDWYAYEAFGTHMSEELLLSLGYFSDEELERRRRKGLPLPPPARWVNSNMRRPFALISNAIASMRTLRNGNLGVKVQSFLGRNRFKGLQIVSTGNVPQGGFSSSSAVTVAVKNAINALFDIGIPADMLVHLACQAEYGTGVRSGALDQATEQKGRAGEGTLISSNPKDNYRIIGSYPAPTDRFKIIFPYSVERDKEAWRWSWGVYAAGGDGARLTTGEMRKLTGKAAELAAILTRLPLETDFFKEIEDDLVQDGLLGLQSREWICDILRRTPRLIKRRELRKKVQENRDWYVEQLIKSENLDASFAGKKADETFATLFAGWREPLLRRNAPNGVVEEKGVPLRAMLAYLFGEAAKNFYLIYHPDQWIEFVTLSQRGDRCVDIAPETLPSREEMQSEMPWEVGLAGPELLNRWLLRFGAKPFDYNAGLDDASLSQENPPEFHRLPGSNFFRGLALIDLAEAMLKRAFGDDAVAVRVNAAGQGDYFQVHVDSHKADINDVKQFIRTAFYRRFNLTPAHEFVELAPGGGAVGIRLSRYDALPKLVQRLKNHLLKKQGIKLDCCRSR